MEIEKQIKNLKIPKEKIVYHEPMKKHTTFKIGGPAECFIKIESIKDLKEVLNFANQNNVPITIIGYPGKKGKNTNHSRSRRKTRKISANMFTKRNSWIRGIIRNTRNNWWSSKNECWCSW